MDPNEIGVDSESNNESKETNEWTRFGMRLCISAALHPFEYAKVLIQLGYEPIPPRLGKSIWGKPILMLPNIFQYAGYIRKTEGFYGCYNGLAPKLMGAIVSMVFSERIADRLGATTFDQKECDDDDLNDEELCMQFKLNLKREAIITATGIIVAQPFHVISVRMMAQFIGHESLYKTVIGSIVEIYKTEGLTGFYAGLAPKLLCDLACLVLTSSTVFLLNKYCIKDKIGRQYNAGLTQFFFASLLYPLQVVSTCMIVTGSRLMGGKPPVMPIYKNCLDCWNDLQARSELKRGGSLFWRSISPGKNLQRYDIIPLPSIVKYK